MVGRNTNLQMHSLTSQRSPDRAECLSTPARFNTNPNRDFKTFSSVYKGSDCQNVNTMLHPEETTVFLSLSCHVHMVSLSSCLVAKCQKWHLLSNTSPLQGKNNLQCSGRRRRRRKRTKAGVLPGTKKLYSLRLWQIINKHTEPRGI